MRRHDREAILQNPTAWDPIYRAELEAARAFRKVRLGRRTYSPVSVSSRRPRDTATSDPFEDPRFLEPVASNPSLAVPPSDVHISSENGVTLGTRPWAISRDSSVSSTTSFEDSAEARIDHLYSQWVGTDVEVLPSPAPSDCPEPPPAVVPPDQRSRISATPTNVSVRSSRRSLASIHLRTAS